MRLKLDALLKEHGKSKYWVYKQLGMSSQNFERMLRNQTQSIRYERLEALCIMFNCTPNDLFEFDFDLPQKKERSQRLPPSKFPHSRG